METVVGVFSSRHAAHRAALALRERGWPERRVQLLYPEDEPEEIAFLPTDDAEQPGVAKAVGAVVGGAAGGAAGLGLGAVTATLLLPGVGAVTAIGLAAAALLGAGGAAAADRLEEETTTGLPRDELYLYEDALSHGRSIVFAFADDDDQAEEARVVMSAENAESLDAARERWWLALRDAEKRHYET